MFDCELCAQRFIDFESSIQANETAMNGLSLFYAYVLLFDANITSIFEVALFPLPRSAAADAAADLLLCAKCCFVPLARPPSRCCARACLASAARAALAHVYVKVNGRVRARMVARHRVRSNLSSECMGE